MANKKATMTDLRLLIREFIKGTSKRKTYLRGCIHREDGCLWKVG